MGSGYFHFRFNFHAPCHHGRELLREVPDLAPVRVFVIARRVGRSSVHARRLLHVPAKEEVVARVLDGAGYALGEIRTKPGLGEKRVTESTGRGATLFA